MGGFCILRARERFGMREEGEKPRDRDECWRVERRGHAKGGKRERSVRMGGERRPSHSKRYVTHRLWFLSTGPVFRPRGATDSTGFS